MTPRYYVYQIVRLSGWEDHGLQRASQPHCGSAGGTGERLLAGLLAKELCRQAREAFAAHAAAVMPIAFLAQQDEDSQIKVGAGLGMRVTLDLKFYNPGPVCRIRVPGTVGRQAVWAFSLCAPMAWRCMYWLWPHRWSQVWAKPD